jgi:hypothetical protein
LGKCNHEEGWGKVINKFPSLICPICGDFVTDIKYAHVIISPWIRILTGTKKRTSKLFECHNCLGAFFNYRYSMNEMNKLYKNYRDINYVQLRSTWEPWYTKDFNDAHKTSDLVEKRKIALENYLLSLKIESLETIVDVGGDYGQYIPDLGGGKYVIDISEQDLIPGVKRIKSLDEIKEVDLIIYAHVLEHVFSPLDELRKLTNYARYVYVEVPEGTPKINRVRSSKLLSLFNLATSLNPKMWGKFSKPSGGRIKKSKFLRQSEHINFFNEETFKKIGISLNLSILSLSTTQIPSPEGGEAKAIRVVYKKNRAPGS